MLQSSSQPILGLGADAAQQQQSVELSRTPGLSISLAAPPSSPANSPLLSPSSLMKQFAVHSRNHRLIHSTLAQNTELSPRSPSNLSTTPIVSASETALHPVYGVVYSPSNRCRSPSMKGDTVTSSPPLPSPHLHLSAEQANQAWESQWSPFNLKNQQEGKQLTPNHPDKTEDKRQSRWADDDADPEADKGKETSRGKKEVDEEKNDDSSDETKDPEHQQPSEKHFLWDSFHEFLPPDKAVTERQAITINTNTAAAAATVSPRNTRSPRASLFITTASPSDSHSSQSSVVPAAASLTTFPILPLIIPSPRHAPATTHAPPTMSTAALSSIVVSGATPATLAAAAELRRNTEFNKAIPATAAELFADLDTPAVHPRVLSNREPVRFADEKGRRLAAVHLVPDDELQYPIPSKKKPRQKEKPCKVM